MVLLSKLPNLNPYIKPFKDAMQDNFRYIPPRHTCLFDLEKYNTRFFTNVPYVVIAAIVAFIGLAQNDSTVIIASMLFSPIGGQIIRSSVGIMAGNGPQIQIGVINHLTYVLMIWVIGFILGFTLDSKETVDKNNQMVNRASWTDSPSSIFNSVVLAIVSGAVLGLSHRDNDTSLVVAIGIGASLLPPVVNSGMFASFAVKTKDPKYGKMSGKSLGLWFMNYIALLATVSVIFKMYCETPKVI